MPRGTVSFLAAMVAIGPAIAADVPVGHPRKHGKSVVARDAPAFPADEDADLLFTPADGMIRAIRPRFGAPLLPGSSTLPGYYGSSHSYEYQGPYYGGPYVPYWNRLPYACGVYGYC